MAGEDGRGGDGVDGDGCSSGPPARARALVGAACHGEEDAGVSSGWQRQGEVGQGGSAAVELKPSDEIKGERGVGLGRN